MRTERALEPRNDSKLIIDFIANIPLFDELEMPELELVAEQMLLIELEKGEVLFDEWDKGDYVCFVEDGTLEVLKKSLSLPGRTSRTIEAIRTPF